MTSSNPKKIVLRRPSHGNSARISSRQESSEDNEQKMKLNLSDIRGSIESAFCKDMDLPFADDKAHQKDFYTDQELIELETLIDQGPETLKSVEQKDPIGSILAQTYLDVMIQLIQGALNIARHQFQRKYAHYFDNSKQEDIIQIIKVDPVIKNCRQQLITNLESLSIQAKVEDSVTILAQITEEFCINHKEDNFSKHFIQSVCFAAQISSQNQLNADLVFDLEEQKNQVEKKKTRKQSGQRKRSTSNQGKRKGSSKSKDRQKSRPKKFGSQRQSSPAKSNQTSNHKSTQNENTNVANQSSLSIEPTKLKRLDFGLNHTEKISDKFEKSYMLSASVFKMPEVKKPPLTKPKVKMSQLNKAFAKPALKDIQEESSHKTNTSVRSSQFILDITDLEDDHKLTPSRSRGSVGPRPSLRAHKSLQKLPGDQGVEIQYEKSMQLLANLVTIESSSTMKHSLSKKSIITTATVSSETSRVLKEQAEKIRLASDEQYRVAQNRRNEEAAENERLRLVKEAQKDDQRRKAEDEKIRLAKQALEVQKRQLAEAEQIKLIEKAIEVENRKHAEAKKIKLSQLAEADKIKLAQKAVENEKRRRAELAEAEQLRILQEVHEAQKAFALKESTFHLLHSIIIKLRKLRKLEASYSKLRMARCKHSILNKWRLNYKQSKVLAAQRKRAEEAAEAERFRALQDVHEASKSQALIKNIFNLFLQTTTKLRILRKLSNAYIKHRTTKSKHKNLTKWILLYRTKKAIADKRRRIELEEAQKLRIAQQVFEVENRRKIKLAKAERFKLIKLTLEASNALAIKETTFQLIHRTTVKLRLLRKLSKEFKQLSATRCKLNCLKQWLLILQQSKEQEAQRKRAEEAALVERIRIAKQAHEAQKNYALKERTFNIFLQTTTKLKILRKLQNAYTNLRVTKCKHKNLKKWRFIYKKTKALQECEQVHNTLGKEKTLAKFLAIWFHRLHLKLKIKHMQKLQAKFTKRVLTKRFLRQWLSTCVRHKKIVIKTVEIKKVQGMSILQRCWDALINNVNHKRSLRINKGKAKQEYLYWLGKRVVSNLLQNAQCRKAQRTLKKQINRDLNDQIKRKILLNLYRYTQFRAQRTQFDKMITSQIQGVIKHNYLLKWSTKFSMNVACNMLRQTLLAAQKRTGFATIKRVMLVQDASVRLHRENKPKRIMRTIFKALKKYSLRTLLSTQIWQQHRKIQKQNFFLRWVQEYMQTQAKLRTFLQLFICIKNQTAQKAFKVLKSNVQDQRIKQEARQFRLTKLANNAISCLIKFKNRRIRFKNLRKIIQANVLQKLFNLLHLFSQYQKEKHQHVAYLKQQLSRIKQRNALQKFKQKTDTLRLTRKANEQASIYHSEKLFQNAFKCWSQYYQVNQATISSQLKLRRQKKIKTKTILFKLWLNNALVKKRLNKLRSAIKINLWLNKRDQRKLILTWQQETHYLRQLVKVESIALQKIQKRRKSVAIFKLLQSAKLAIFEREKSVQTSWYANKKLKVSVFTCLFQYKEKRILRINQQRQADALIVHSLLIKALKSFQLNLIKQKDLFSLQQQMKQKQIQIYAPQIFQRWLTETLNIKNNRSLQTKALQQIADNHSQLQFKRNVLKGLYIQTRKQQRLRAVHAEVEFRHFQYCCSRFFSNWKTELVFNAACNRASQIYAVRQQLQVFIALRNHAVLQKKAMMVQKINLVTLAVKALQSLKHNIVTKRQIHNEKLVAAITRAEKLKVNTIRAFKLCLKRLSIVKQIQSSQGVNIARRYFVAWEDSLQLKLWRKHFFNSCYRFLLKSSFKKWHQQSVELTQSQTLLTILTNKDHQVLATTFKALKNEYSKSRGLAKLDLVFNRNIYTKTRSSMLKIKAHSVEQFEESKQMLNIIQFFEKRRPQNLLQFQKTFLHLNTGKNANTRVCSTTLAKYVFDKWQNVLPKLRNSQAKSNLASNFDRSTTLFKVMNNWRTRVSNKNETQQMTMVLRQNRYYGIMDKCFDRMRSYADGQVQKRRLMSQACATINRQKLSSSFRRWFATYQTNQSLRQTVICLTDNRDTKLMQKALQVLQFHSYKQRCVKQVETVYRQRREHRYKSIVFARFFKVMQQDQKRRTQQNLVSLFRRKYLLKQAMWSLQAAKKEMQSKHAYSRKFLLFTAWKAQTKENMLVNKYLKECNYQSKARSYQHELSSITNCDEETKEQFEIGHLSFADHSNQLKDYSTAPVSHKGQKNEFETTKKDINFLFGCQPTDYNQESYDDEHQVQLLMPVYKRRI